MRRHITESEAVQELGFKSLWVWRDDLNTNVQAVEAALQRACDDLELGVCLHRVSGAGKGIKHPSFEGSGVYITFSDQVQNKIDAGEVVGTTELSFSEEVENKNRCQDRSRKKMATRFDRLHCPGWIMLGSRSRASWGMRESPRSANRSRR